jgi:hypothetical protein
MEAYREAPEASIGTGLLTPAGRSRREVALLTSRRKEAHHTELFRSTVQAKETAMNKKSPKKLVLCTETLRNLEERDLQHAAGATAAASDCGSACLCTATHVCSNCRPCF